MKSKSLMVCGTVDALRDQILMRATLHHLNKLANRSHHAEGSGVSTGCVRNVRI